MDGAGGEIETALARADRELGRVIAAVMARIGPLRIPPSRASPFQALLRAIVYQSVSAKAAAAIHRRLVGLTGETKPREVLTLSRNAKRGIGLSSAKSASIANLACWFEVHSDLAARLPSMPDESIIAALIATPGIGLWTVNVFLIFNLRRPNVVPATDLASDGQPNWPTASTVRLLRRWFERRRDSGGRTPVSPRFIYGTPSG